jgi:hypothetical protein
MGIIDQDTGERKGSDEELMLRKLILNQMIRNSHAQDNWLFEYAGLFTLVFYQFSVAYG